MLAPSGIGLFTQSGDATKKGKRPASQASQEVDGDGNGGKVLARFGRRYLIVKTRKRVTVDGGASILVVGNP